MPSLPWQSTAILFLTPAMIAVGQVLFKMTGARLQTENAPFLSIALNPIFLLALVIYGLSTLAWVHVLKSAPLSYAYSFMALTFIIVPLLASLWLHEPIGWRYMLGAALIVSGLIIVQT